MSTILRASDNNFRIKLEESISKQRINQKNLSLPVSEIIREVRKRKDRALVELTKRFDKIKLTEKELKFSQEEIDRLLEIVPLIERKALQKAAERITKFHEKQVPKNKY